LRSNISSHFIRLFTIIFEYFAPSTHFCYRRKITVFSTTLAAFTIDHGEPKSLGPDLFVSYHDNDHYNSVRERKSPPKPIKNMTGTKRNSIDDGNKCQEPQNKNNANDIPKQQSKDSEGISGGDPLSGCTEAVTKSMSALSCNENGSIVDKKVKKSAPCPCGSGVKYKKCCLAKQKRASVKKKKKAAEPGRGEDADSEPEEPLKSRGQFQVVSI
jgi:hypothetical protein